MNCCDHHADQLPCGCNQGRSCPARKPADLGSAWRYIKGYVPIMAQFWDHAAAKRAGHLAAITRPEPDGIEFIGREPMSGEAKVLIAAVTVTWLTVIALSCSDSLVMLWPRMVAALSAWPIN